MIEHVWDGLQQEHLWVSGFGGIRSRSSSSGVRSRSYPSLISCWVISRAAALEVGWNSKSSSLSDFHVTKGSVSPDGWAVDPWPLLGTGSLLRGRSIFLGWVSMHAFRVCCRIFFDCCMCRSNRLWSWSALDFDAAWSCGVFCGSSRGDSWSFSWAPSSSFMSASPPSNFITGTGTSCCGRSPPLQLFVLESLSIPLSSMVPRDL